MLLSTLLINFWEAIYTSNVRPDQSYTYGLFGFWLIVAKGGSVISNIALAETGSAHAFVPRNCPTSTCVHPHFLAALCLNSICGGFVLNGIRTCENYTTQSKPTIHVHIDNKRHKHLVWHAHSHSR